MAQVHEAAKKHPSWSAEYFRLSDASNPLICREGAPGYSAAGSTRKQEPRRSAISAAIRPQRHQRGTGHGLNSNSSHVYTL